MHLVAFVVAGERVHHEIDAEAHGEFALVVAAGHGREHRPAAGIKRPRTRPVVGTDHDRGYAVFVARIGLFDPHRRPREAPGEVLHQIEGLGQHMLGRYPHQARQIERAQEIAQALRRRAGR